MKTRNMFLAICRYISVKDSLKILELTPPTTKNQIKKKYLILAKKYHPDANEEIKNLSDKAKIQEIHKKLEEKFVQLSKAYQYLKQLSEEDINSLKDKNSTSSESSRSQAGQNQRRQRQAKRKMTVQQMTRKQAYDYFNQVYRKQAMQQDIYDGSYTTNKKQKQSLFKTIPEIFVGFLLLAVMLGDWSYRVYKRKQGQQVKTTPSPTRLQYAEVFKGMNSNDKFNKKERNSKFEILQ